MSSSTDQYIYQQQMKWAAQDSVASLHRIEDKLSNKQEAVPQTQASTYINPNDSFMWNYDPPKEEGSFLFLIYPVTILIVIFLLGKYRK